MATTAQRLIILAVFALNAPYVFAAAKPKLNDDAKQIETYGPPVELKSLLCSVSKLSGKSFLVDARVAAHVTVGEVDQKKITYPLLLSVLRNNGLAAVTVEGLVNIVPVQIVRQYPIPTVNTDDSTIADHEWVTRLLPLSNATAAQMVPIFRPLFPQAGHMAAFKEANSLLMVAPYGNIRRITDLVLALDKTSIRQQ